MGDTTMEQIDDAIKLEQKPGGKPKALQRLYACKWRKEGDKLDVIATRLSKSPKTVYDWLVRMNRDGLDGRYDKKKPGRHPKIPKILYIAIAVVVKLGPLKCGMNSNNWTGRLLVIMLYKKFELEVSPSTVYRTMHKLCISYRLPSRPFNERAPSDEVKEKFKLDLGHRFVN